MSSDAIGRRQFNPLAFPAATVGPEKAVGPERLEGMFRAHGLERHVKVYTLTDSDMELLGLLGAIFDICTGTGFFFFSTAITCFLAGGATAPKTSWTAQQYALFQYTPWGCIVITVISFILGGVVFCRRKSTRDKIKQESFTPGTYRD